eukprot:CAMPEP_0172319808 /NCGR_PEP_ID=MMETSP1058-20130122/38775_1 /TAXON_ID=83371 /ORGANISM="Detonula confervacea, Strain CCMP 353" /LENGTH=593 /DNA_ID=CAMNT_0013034935 /DNA_START=111 /DNA_END=1892 /DNA_ORIENTATION=+
MPFLSPKGEPLQNPYQLLDLEHGANDDEIGKSFKKLMLQLHPDKQPAGQSAEETERTSQKFHNVMDAKSFLMDGEHLAARREYDSKLVRAKQQPPVSFGGGNGILFAPKPKPEQAKAARGAAAPKKNGNPVSSTSERKYSHGVKTPADGRSKQSSATKSDFKAKPASFPKNNVTKQWGRVNRSSARPVTRRASDEKKDPMENKTHTRARGRAFNDSCGDCSTTDDCSATNDDGLKRQHTYSNTTACNANNKPSSNRPSMSRARHAVPRPLNNNTSNRQNSCNERSKSDPDITRGRNNGPSDDTNRKKAAGTIRSDCKKSEQQPRSGYKPADACKSADFSTFYPAIDILEKQYHCPLTKEMMLEPMVDFEGNSYERIAILKYLETHITSPVTGNPLSSMHLTPNTAIIDKIRYTSKLKTCLDSLQNATQLPPKPQPREPKYKSSIEAVDSFIRDLNSGSPAVTITQLDSSGSTIFSYRGLKFRLEVPDGVADNIMVHTRFEHNKKAAGISGRVVQFNAALQKMGLDGKLTYRNINGKNVFTLTKKMDLEKFSKTSLRHSIEYFLEMTIKLHNIINTTDVIKVVKVRLTNTVAGH